MTGERVTTGSEPRRAEQVSIVRTELIEAGDLIPDGFLPGWSLILAERIVNALVGSGHDEQNLAQSRPDAIGQSKVWDERTVAAVVEALREEDHMDRHGYVAFIEERFKPSAPGGDDG